MFEKWMNYVMLRSFMILATVAAIALNCRFNATINDEIFIESVRTGVKAC